MDASLIQAFAVVCEHESALRNERAMRSFRHLALSYFHWLDSMDLTVDAVGIAEAEDYQAFCATATTKTGQAYAEGSIGNLVHAASVCHRLLKQVGLCQENPFPAIKQIRRRQKPIRNVLSEVHMARLMEYFAAFTNHRGSEKKQAYRVHVIVELLQATGMRISEASGLSPADVHLDDRQIWIRQAKNGHARMAYITDEAATALRAWLDIGRPVIVAPDDARLFGLSYGVMTKLINTHLHAACRVLHLPPITSHCFRHCVGYHLLRSGCDIRYIQAILGHEQIDSTKTYTRVDKEDLVHLLEDHHPRAFLHGGLRIAAVEHLKVNRRRLRTVP